MQKAFRFGDWEVAAEHCLPARSLEHLGNPTAVVEMGEDKQGHPPTLEFTKASRVVLTGTGILGGCSCAAWQMRDEGNLQEDGGTGDTKDLTA